MNHICSYSSKDCFEMVDFFLHEDVLFCFILDIFHNLLHKFCLSVSTNQIPLTLLTIILCYLLIKLWWHYFSLMLLHRRHYLELFPFNKCDLLWLQYTLSEAPVQELLPIQIHRVFLICYKSANSPGGVEWSAHSHSEGVFCIKKSFWADVSLRRGEEKKSVFNNAVRRHRAIYIFNY